ncbi:MAG TPA: ABC transporter permease, partial [Flavobacteriales bacterium]|nr:ABC transporter permease [Flavobacteriales bacterium]
IQADRRGGQEDRRLMGPAMKEARFEDQQWDVVIRPDRPWWNIDLKEIWSYRDLLALLVRRDLTAVYKQTILGPVWQVLQPLLTSIMFAVVFGVIFKRASMAGIPPLLFYMSAIVPWGFFSGVITRTSQTLVWNQALMTKVYFPRLVAPLATVLSTGFSFLVQLSAFLLFAVVFAVLGKFQWHLGQALLAVPVLVLLLTLFAFGLGIMVAALTTRFRDLSLLIGFAVQLLMYMSPVIFPLSIAKEGSTLRLLLKANPVTPIIEGFRAAFFGLPMEWNTLWYSAAASLVALVVGLIMFQRVERSFADVV